MEWHPEPNPWDEENRRPQDRLAQVLNFSVPVLRIFGIQVRVHWSLAFWVILLAYWTRQAVPEAGILTCLAWGLVLAIVLDFLLVLPHELGHAAAAAMNRIPTSRIVLNILGGLAMIDEPPRNPAMETQITMAGPLVSWLLVGISFAVISVTDGWPLTGGEPFTVSGALYFAFYANFLMAVFNLVPAFPLDGGRVLRALIAWRKGPRRGTVVAGRIGQVLGVAMAGYGIYRGMTAGWLLIGIGVSCFLNCERAIRFVRWGFPVYQDAQPMDFAAPAYDEPVHKPTRAERRAEKARLEAEELEQNLDEILDKVAREGMASLTRAERAILDRASRHYRGTKH